MITSNKWIDIVLDPNAVRSTARMKMEPDPSCEIIIGGMDSLDILEAVLDNYVVYSEEQQKLIRVLIKQFVEGHSDESIF